MGTVLIICATVVISVYILAHTHVRITVTHHGDDYCGTDDPGITDSAIMKAYEDLEKDPVPTFTDVINVINKEFGGVDYEE